MSYILDALRRSQAERERGQVPGLDARPAAVAALPAATPGRAWRWVALGAVAAAGVVIALLWWTRSAPPAAPAVPATIPTDPVAGNLPGNAPGDAPGSAPVKMAEVAPTPASAAEVPPPLPVVVSAPVTPLPAAAPAPRPVSPPSPVSPAAPGVPTAAGAPGAAVPPAAGAGVAPTPLAMLTPAQRRELPPLVLGGSIWSDSALSRFVIVNGQVVREGETAAPGVVVERIEARRVLLRWRDLRLDVPL